MDNGDDPCCNPRSVIMLDAYKRMKHPLRTNKNKLFSPDFSRIFRPIDATSAAETVFASKAIRTDAEQKVGKIPTVLIHKEPWKKHNNMFLHHHNKGVITRL